MPEISNYTGKEVLTLEECDEFLKNRIMTKKKLVIGKKVLWL